MKVTKNKITFQKSDRILFDGTYITNNHVIFNPAKVSREVSLPNTQIFKKYVSQEPFDFDFDEIRELTIDISKTLDPLKTTVASLEVTPLYVKDDDDLKLQILKEPVSKELSVVNPTYLNIFSNLGFYVGENQDLIGAFNGTEWVGGLMIVDHLDLKETLQNIIE